MDKATPESRPEALLLIAPGCPHCAAVLEGLSTLVKEAVIGRLEVVNIASEPEQAQSLGVRSVPWTRIGPFELEGLHGPQELRRWAEQSGHGEGMAVYFDELLKKGKRDKVERIVRRQPHYLVPLIELLGDKGTGIHTRIGIMAILEDLENTELGASVVDPLAALTSSQDNRIRVDACQALSLTGSAAAIPHLKACLNDPDAEVRETAQEALEELGEQRG